MGIVLALGEWRDALFGLVMILNLAIGVVQDGGPNGLSIGSR